MLRDSERADITFVCPQCGAEITVTAVVPSFLLAAIEALAEEGGPSPTNARPNAADEAEVTEAYCEYFRRQLAHVECVEDALHEIDAAR
jgi:hypothetical protein